MVVKKIMAYALVLVFSMGVEAGLISRDYVEQGDAGLVYDDVNNKEWLTIDWTAGLSFADALATYSSDDFRLATNDEVTDLYYDFWDDSLNLEIYDLRFQMTYDDQQLGQWIDLFGSNSKVAGQNTNYLLYQDEDDVTRFFGARQTSSDETSFNVSGLEHYLDASQYVNSPNPWFGVALVRDAQPMLARAAAVNVSEPLPLSIILAGFAALALRRLNS
mgnify:CR=1 FL=1